MTLIVSSENINVGRETTVNETYSNNQLPDNSNFTVVGGTVKSLELIVLSGIVSLDNIPFPKGTWPINASNGVYIENDLIFNVGKGAMAYLQKLA